MKLEVGMYVRFKDKRGNTYIRKITKLANEYPQKLYGMEVDKETNYNIYLSTRNILKTSHTLLGNDEEPCLIEVGDYVNGCLVDADDLLGKYIVLYDVEDRQYKRIYLSDIYIESIVTKEQFEQMQYKVGD